MLADGRLLFADDVAELLIRRAHGDAGTFDEVVGRYRTWALLWPAGQLALDPERWRRVWSDPVADVWLPRPVWDAVHPQVLDALRRRGITDDPLR